VRTVPTRGRDCRGAARRRVRALRRRSGQLGWAARGRRYGSGRRSSRWRAQGAADGLCAWRQERDPRRGAGKHRCGTCAERALPMVASVASTRSRVAGIDPHQAQCRADRNPLPGRGRAGDRCVNERRPVSQSRARQATRARIDGGGDVRGRFSPYLNSMTQAQPRRQAVPLAASLHKVFEPRGMVSSARTRQMGAVERSRARILTEQQISPSRRISEAALR
jgi:hypothetical protein